MRSIGGVLVAIGIPGLFLPILQGFLLIAAGVFLLTIGTTWRYRTLEKLRPKHPSLVKFLEEFERKTQRLFGIRNEQ